MDVRNFDHFGDLVRSLRRRHRLSQRALARALAVSPGYVGQWELRLSQPSAEVTLQLCQVFQIDDVEQVQRLAFAQRAPQWLRESTVHYRQAPAAGELSSAERRVLAALRRLSDEQAERLVDRVEGWVEALAGDQDRRREP